MLNGVEITLSSILPSTPIPSRKNDLLLDRIEKCGALYNEKLEPSTTHLVAAKEGTQKFFQVCNIFRKESTREKERLKEEKN